MSRRTIGLALMFSGWMLGCGGDATVSTPSEEIIENLLAAGFPASEIQVAHGAVYVGGDAEVSLTASREMLQVGNDSQEHYRTINMVSADIGEIIIRPASNIPTSVRLQLTEAIANFNDLSLRFSFQLAPHPCEADPNCPPRPPYSTIDLVINPGLPTTGTTSRLPSNGNAGSRIEIGSSVGQLPANQIKHLLTHEIGHTLGLRHTDYFNRAVSCGGVATNEGVANVGAIHITGTPTGVPTDGSLMFACMASNTTGEFSGSDVTALQTLYGAP
ncbi:zinc-dependent metalloprotease [Myxococcus stipitatus]|uniref:M57 family metalloprotease n=1 Tax=Myxococcus stipitatus TaxID=83455 RepID=UPI001F2613A4|nr:M57 family metalloprotease [Myxococcus stipitatus]MCE9672881.1 zinc-dependent metalloprotease [Myxococcus stipitatus]